MKMISVSNRKVAFPRTRIFMKMSSFRVIAEEAL